MSASGHKQTKSQALKVVRLTPESRPQWGRVNVVTDYLEQLEAALSKKHTIRKLAVSDTGPAFEGYDILLSTSMRAKEVLADAITKADLIIVDEAQWAVDCGLHLGKKNALLLMSAPTGARLAR